MLESTRLAQAADLDPEVLYQVGQANGVVADFNHRFISNRGAVFDGCDAATARAIFQPFGKLGEKDLDAALETAAAFGLELPAASSNRQLIMDGYLYSTLTRASMSKPAQGEARLLIDGELVNAASGNTYANINPATEEEMAPVADAGTNDMERAISAARRAFDDSDWSGNHQFRAHCLRQL